MRDPLDNQAETTGTASGGFGIPIGLGTKGDPLVVDWFDELQIVVADRGHVWVGEVCQAQDGSSLYIRDARIVRRWGTTHGLNQLAIEGPQPNTRLDQAADVIVPHRAVIARIACARSAWVKTEAEPHG